MGEMRPQHPRGDLFCGWCEGVYAAVSRDLRSALLLKIQESVCDGRAENRWRKCRCAPSKGKIRPFRRG